MLANFSFQPRAARRSGFTIIELLVAVSITVVMVALMLTVVTNTLNVWNRTSGDLTAENQARQIMDQIALDLQSAIFRSDNNAWLVATVQTSGGASGMNNESWNGAKSAGDSLDLDPARGRATDRFEDARFGQGGMWLRFFTNSRESNSDTMSGPRAVSYQIIRRRATAISPYAYQLFRSAVTHQNTFTTGYDLFMPANSTSYNVGLGTAGAPGNIRRPNASFLLANNVIDFGVRFLLSDAAGTVLFPQENGDLGFAATSDITRFPPVPVDAGYNLGNFQRGFPEVADVYVRILTGEGARLILALENGDIEGDWWEIALANSQVYTRRVMIASRPL